MGEPVGPGTVDPPGAPDGAVADNEFPPQLVECNFDALSAPLVVGIPRVPEGATVPCSPFRTDRTITKVRVDNKPVKVELGVGIAVPDADTPKAPTVEGPVGTDATYTTTIPVAPLAAHYAIPTADSVWWPTQSPVDHSDGP